MGCYRRRGGGRLIEKKKKKEVVVLLEWWPTMLEWCLLCRSQGQGNWSFLWYCSDLLFKLVTSQTYRIFACDY